MTEIDREIRELKKLNKMDLIVLLEELGGELENFEKDSRGKEERIRELMQENEALHRQADALNEKNESLVSQIQVVNKRLLEMEEHPNMRAMETVAQKMSEIALKTSRQMEELKEMEAERRKDAGHEAKMKAQSIIESAQIRAAGITSQLQKTNLEMLANMQEAINQARKGYETVFEEEACGHERNEGKICEFPSPDKREQDEQVVLSAEQARNLLKVLKRFGKPEKAKQAE